VPSTIKRLEEQRTKRASPVIRRFHNKFMELKGQTFQKLSTCVKEKKSKEDWFLEISVRDEKANRESEVTSRNETKQKLEDELEEIKTSIIDETKIVQTNTKAQQGADFTNFQAKDSSLRDGLARLQAEPAHKIKNENEVEMWILKYNQDMDEEKCGSQHCMQYTRRKEKS